MSSPILRLSQELIDELLDRVATSQLWWPGQWKDLSNCALVCRSFLPRAQKHLFSCISISGGHTRQEVKNRTKRCKKLYHILQRKPHIAGYIVELNMTLCYDTEESWITNDPTLNRIMGLIKEAKGAFRKLRLGGNGRDAMQPKLINNFMQSFISPVITSLYLESLANCPAEMIASCGKLTELTLYDVQLDFTPGGVQQDVPRLRRLTINSTPRALELLIGRTKSSVSDLKVLILHTDAVRNVEFDNLLEACSGSLEELYIKPEDDLEYTVKFNGYINLQSSFNLRILESHIVFRVEELDNLATLCNSLSTISSNDVRNIRLKIYLGFDCDPYEAGFPEPDAFLSADWDGFCRKLIPVISGRSFELSLSMRYMDWNAKRIGTHASRQGLHESCDRVLNTLFRNKLSSLTCIPETTVTIILDHRLYPAYDSFAWTPFLDPRGPLSWTSSGDGKQPTQTRLRA